MRRLMTPAGAGYVYSETDGSGMLAVILDSDHRRNPSIYWVRPDETAPLECRHCGRPVRQSGSIWVHEATGRHWCYVSAEGETEDKYAPVTMAEPPAV